MNINPSDLLAYSVDLGCVIVLIVGVIYGRIERKRRIKKSLAKLGQMFETIADVRIEAMKSSIPNQSEVDG